MRQFEECITDWCKVTEDLLTQTNRIKDGEEPGPDTELEYWRTRMSNFNSITEHLKTKECKLVLGVCAAAKSKGYARWKSLDIQVRGWWLGPAGAVGGTAPWATSGRRRQRLSCQEGGDSDS